MKQKSQRVYITKVVVRVSGQPIDMMRYDRCVPFTEEDSGKLYRVVTHNKPTAEDFRITFLRYSLNPGPPTIERWRSYNCEVISWEHQW